jgi:hypothetical protein
VLFIVIYWTVSFLIFIIQENLSEELHRKLVHNSRRGAADASVKPNKDEKSRIDKILQSAGSGPRTSEENDFLYRY